jgi:hypothetical protein
MRLEFWLSITLLLFACKTTERKGNQAVEKHDIALLEKTGCLGTCPVYKIAIISDKTFQFIGHAHVAKIGEYIDTLTEKEFQNIVDAISDERFFLLDSMYMEPIMDIPTTYIVTQINNYTKRISCNMDPPKAFKLVEEAIKIPLTKRGWLRNEIISRHNEELEWIIDLFDENAADKLQEKYPQFDLTLIKRISPTLSYFLYRMRLPDDWSSEQVREILLSDPLVREAELNKKLERR